MTYNHRECEHDPSGSKRRHTPKFLYYTLHTHVYSFKELEQKIDLNRQPWFTSFLVQQTQTQITKPEFPKKKEERRKKNSNDITPHHHWMCTTPKKNHPIHPIHPIRCIFMMKYIKYIEHTQHTKQLCGRRYILQNLFYVYDSEL